VFDGDTLIGRQPKTDQERLMNKQRCAAVFRWMRERLGMQMVAIVDTGNKSLHGWFRHPGADVIGELVEILPHWGFDRALFKPCQPVRMPGFVRRFDDGRTPRMQELLWLDPSNSN